MFKATMGGLEAHLHQAYKHCVIGAIPDGTEECIRCTPIHPHRFVMELLQ